MFPCCVAVGCMDRHKVPVWKKALGVLSTVTSVLPSVGAIGRGITAGISFINLFSNEPMDTTSGLFGIARRRRQGEA